MGLLNRKTKLLVVALCLSALLIVSISVLIGYSQTAFSGRKLSPHLQMLTSTDPDQVDIGKKHVHLKSAGKYAEPMVDALVRFEGDPKALEAYGARVRSILGNVATMDIPLGMLETIAGHPHVIRIEEARKLKHRLDISVPASGANGLGLWGNAMNPAGSSGAKLRPLPPPWTGNTGQNVVVGDVDTGIDLNHADFKDSLGNSRLLYIWDQTSNGTPPAGFSYGNECTNQQINNGTCTQTDSEGHGTHVMGIAAGNGSATGNGQLAYRYIGMAPQADLIMVNTDFYDSDIIDGVAYIQSKAAALSLPSVVNLSLGGHFGPHDGTSNFEVAMDAASGTGKVVVVAAGNEATDNIHASGTVANGGTVAVSFSVPSGSTDVLLDLWYPGADQFGVNVVSPSGSCTIPSSGFRYPGNSDVSSNTNCGFVIISTPATNPANGDHEIIIELQTGSRSVRTGTWTFTLTGSGCGSSPCVTNGAFDVWIDDTSSSATFNPGYRDPSKTVGMPGTATKVVTVGAYTTKTSWTSSNGSGTDFYGTVGHISYFSSLGPRRSCSNTSNPVCTAVVQKPELAAPGEEIMSSHAAGTTTTGVCFDTTTPTKCLDPDGKHIIFQGTSMATPHVAGAAALLLAQNPALTSDQVKAALEHTRTDSYTSSTPNNTWGYGKLAVDLAIASVGTTTTTTTTTSTTTTTTIPNQPPSADSLSPVNITTTPSVAQSFTAVYSDPDGYENISDASLLVSGNTHNERVDYIPATNKFTLMGAGGNCSPGQAATLSDGYLTLNCASSSTAGSGTTLTVVFNLTPQPSLSGAPYQLMISVIDQGGASNSKTPGTWIINRPPSADSVSPMNSTTAVGTAQTFTAVYSDPDGWQNIAAANFYLSGNGGVHNEWLHYLVAPNLFTMMGSNDFCSPGQAKTLSSGYLTLDCSASSVSGSGNTLTVMFNVTPQPPSSGLQYNIFTAASDQAGAAYAIFAGTWQIP